VIHPERYPILIHFEFAKEDGVKKKEEQGTKEDEHYRPKGYAFNYGKDANYHIKTENAED